MGSVEQNGSTRGAMKLAAEWARAAGLHITWIGRADAMSQALTDPDPGRRAHWRCAVELVQLCALESGRDVAELLADLALEPVEQGAGESVPIQRIAIERGSNGWWVALERATSAGCIAFVGMPFATLALAVEWVAKLDLSDGCYRLSAAPTVESTTRAGPSCCKCAHVHPVEIVPDGDGHRLYPLLPIALEDERSFSMFNGASLVSGKRRELRCNAPQLAGMIYEGGDSTGCNSARDFNFACGIEGKWFIERIGNDFSYHGAYPGAPAYCKPRDYQVGPVVGESGQASVSHARHGLPEQSSGRQQSDAIEPAPDQLSRTT